MLHICKTTYKLVQKKKKIQYTESNKHWPSIFTVLLNIMLCNKSSISHHITAAFFSVGLFTLMLSQGHLKKGNNMIFYQSETKQKSLNGAILTWTYRIGVSSAFYWSTMWHTHLCLVSRIYSNKLKIKIFYDHFAELKWGRV